MDARSLLGILGASLLTVSAGLTVPSIQRYETRHEQTPRKEFVLPKHTPSATPYRIIPSPTPSPVPTPIVYPLNLTTGLVENSMNAIRSMQVEEDVVYPDDPQSNYHVLTMLQKPDRISQTATYRFDKSSSVQIGARQVRIFDDFRQTYTDQIPPDDYDFRLYLLNIRLAHTAQVTKTSCDDKECYILKSFSDEPSQIVQSEISVDAQTFLVSEATVTLNPTYGTKVVHYYKFTDYGKDFGIQFPR